MAVVQISKIQIRRGKKNSDSGVPQLSSAELAWAVDTQELFIGNGSVEEGAPQVGNTKILTNNDNILEEVIKKVRKDGSIRVSGIDGLEMCRQVFYGSVKIEDASKFFGATKRLNSITSIRSFFEDRGLEIKFAGIDSGRYFVEAKKK